MPRSYSGTVESGCDHLTIVEASKCDKDGIILNPKAFCVEEESLLESWSVQLTEIQTTGASYSICVLFYNFFF